MKTGYAALLFALLAPWVLSGEAPQVTPAPKEQAWWQQNHEKFVAQAKQGGIEVLFIGDSITERWATDGKAAWEKHFAPLKAANFGIGGDKVEHILWRAQNGELNSLKPKVVVLLAGINNTWGCKRDEQQARGEFIGAGLADILKIVRAKLPEAKVLLLAILPLADGRAPCVKVANERLEKLADGQQVRFLDLVEKLAPGNGQASKDIMPDGVHLSPKGYELWAEGLLPVLQNMLGGGAKPAK